MARYSEEQLRNYIEDVLEKNALHEEIARLKSILATLSIMKESDTAFKISLATQAFQTLLTEKARQNTIDKMGNYNRCNAKHTGPSPANNTRAGVSVGDILEKKVTRSGQ